MRRAGRYVRERFYFRNGARGAYAALALEERVQAGWPPFSHLALWRAEAVERAPEFEFLGKLERLTASRAEGVDVLGPAPNPMERRGGRYRAQLLFQAREPPKLHALIETCLATARTWKEARRVRWSVDVDPIEL